MYECERLFGVQRGLEMQEMVQAATKGDCPCKRGVGCLLAPKARDVVPAEVA